MHKQIVLVFTIIFNMSMYSQVVIKDEIMLDETLIEIKQSEIAGLTMPFYGRVYSQIPCQWNHWTSGAIKITRIAGGQTDLSGCYDYVCGGGGWCACTAGTRAVNFYNVPQGSEIIVEIQRCFDPPPSPPYDPSWHEVPLGFTYVGNNRYDLYGQDLSDGSWDYIGYFRFYPTTPPACCPLTDGPCAPLCEQPFVPPDTNIYRIPDPSRCNDTVKDIPAGVFTPHYWGLGDGEEVIATPCQDPMTGNIKFKFSTNYRTTIDLPYNLELCPDRIEYLSLTRIDSEEEFEDYLINNVSNENDACTIRQLILNHKGFDSQGNQTGGEILSPNGIWITASTLAHEYEHERDY